MKDASTRRTDEIITVGFGTIQVVPVWRFLLEMELRAYNSGRLFFRFAPVPKITVSIGLISYPMAL